MESIAPTQTDTPTCSTETTRSSNRSVNVWSSSLRTRAVGTPLSNAVTSQKQHAVSNNTASHYAMVERMGVWEQYGTVILSSRSRCKSSSQARTTQLLISSRFPQFDVPSPHHPISTLANSRRSMSLKVVNAW